NYTDISSSFLRHGRERFGSEFPDIQYGVLDIEERSHVVKYPKHSFDIVYASNVLHDTRYLKYTLSQIRYLLKDDGFLALNEFTAMKDVLLFTGGLLHGWWLFEDPEN